MKNRKSEWVSASKIGRAAFCPHSLELEAKGAAVSSKAKAARLKGDIAHEKINQQTQDKRCYVASHLYGIDDPRTQCLRRFRDDYLVSHFLGRILTSIYYRLSPSLVTLARHHKATDKALSKIVGFIIRKLGHEDTI